MGRRSHTGLLIKPLYKLPSNICPPSLMSSGNLATASILNAEVTVLSLTWISVPFYQMPLKYHIFLSLDSFFPHFLQFSTASLFPPSPGQKLCVFQSSRPSLPVSNYQVLLVPFHPKFVRRTSSPLFSQSPQNAGFTLFLNDIGTHEFSYLHSILKSLCQSGSGTEAEILYYKELLTKY